MKVSLHQYKDSFDRIVVELDGVEIGHAVRELGDWWRFDADGGSPVNIWLLDGKKYSSLDSLRHEIIETHQKLPGKPATELKMKSVEAKIGRILVIAEEVAELVEGDLDQAYVHEMERVKVACDRFLEGEPRE